MFFYVSSVNQIYTAWEKGQLVHERCYITLSAKRSLHQFQKKKEKENAEKIPAIPEQQDLLGEKFKPSSPKRLQFSTGGPSYHENKCV